MTTYALLAILVLLLLALPVWAATASPEGETGSTVGRATIEVNGKPSKFTQQDGYSIRRATLTTRDGRLVGRSHLICFTISRWERGCNGTYTFPRGTITVAGTVQANGYFLAVTGGTGFYDNARGAMKVAPSGAALRHRVFFQLVG